MGIKWKKHKGNKTDEEMEWGLTLAREEVSSELEEALLSPSSIRMEITVPAVVIGTPAPLSNSDES